MTTAPGFKPTPISGPIVAALARGAGVGDKDLVTMVAIAFRESHWDATQINHNTNGTIDHGLWQINQPAFNPSLLDPNTNARVMGQMYKSRGLQPWTFGSSHGPRTWRPYLPQAKQAVSTMDSVGGTIDAGTESHVGFSVDLPTPEGVLGGIGDMASAAVAGAQAFVLMVSFLTDPRNWIRVGEVIAGALLVLVGLYVLFTSTRIGAQMKDDAKQTGQVVGMAAAA